MIGSSHPPAALQSSRPGSAGDAQGPAALERDLDSVPAVAATFAATTAQPPSR